MSSTLVEIISGIGVTIGAVLSFLGGRLTQRQALKAQKTTQELERSKIDAAAYSEARKIWDDIIKDLRDTVTDQRREMSDLRREFDVQRARLEDLEYKRAGDRRAIHTLTEYARQLLKVIKDNDLVPPEPPEGLDLEG